MAVRRRCGRGGEPWPGEGEGEGGLWGRVGEWTLTLGSLGERVRQVRVSDSRAGDRCMEGRVAWFCDREKFG